MIKDLEKDGEAEAGCTEGLEGSREECGEITMRTVFVGISHGDSVLRRVSSIITL